MAKWLNVLKCCCFLWFSPCHYASILFALFTRFLLFVCLAQLIFPSAQIRFVVKWMFSIIETHSQTYTHTTHTHKHTLTRILNVWMLFFLCLMLSAVSNYESAALWEKLFTDEFIWCANLCPLIKKLICIMVISLISLPLSLSLSVSRSSGPRWVERWSGHCRNYWASRSHWTPWSSWKCWTTRTCAFVFVHMFDFK